ncbi:MAG: hypothetical protein KA354_05485 [Phycisphaerae bacterium]|nr:hypothetical protein [Phycisphaerae bacterium]
MPGRPYYDLASLPAVGELGSPAPLNAEQLLERFERESSARTLMETFFLFDDLVQREAFLAGEIQETHPVVLSVPEARGESPLPPYLAGFGVDDGAAEDGLNARHRAVEVDSLWEAYFRYAAGVAERTGSGVLSGWVRSEVGLRNALATARARRLGLDPADYLVASDLAEGGRDFAATVNDWASARTPLAGQQVLIQARWAWLAERDPWFTFTDDEFAVYAARIMLLEHWRRIVEANERRAAGEPVHGASGTVERVSS